MARVSSDSKGLNQVQINGGRVVRKHRDGTFHVPDPVAKLMLKNSDEFGFSAAGTKFAEIKGGGFFCPNCGRENIISNHCGRCDWTANGVCPDDSHPGASTPHPRVHGCYEWIQETI